MNTTRTVVPTEPYTLAELKTLTRSDQDTTAHDALLLRIQTAAREFTERATGRLLGAQTWQTFAMYWPKANYLVIPSSPVTAIQYFQYNTIDGLLTIPETDYTLYPAINTYQAVQLKPGVTWPSDYLYIPGICITYTAGYNPIPSQLLEALSSLITYWYDNPEAAIASTTYKAEAAMLPLHYMDLIAQFTLWRR